MWIKSLPILSICNFMFATLNAATTSPLSPLFYSWAASKCVFLTNWILSVSPFFFPDPSSLLKTLGSRLQHAYPSLNPSYLASLLGDPLIKDSAPARPAQFSPTEPSFKSLWPMEIPGSAVAPYSSFSVKSAAKERFHNVWSSFRRLEAVTPSTLVFKPFANIKVSRQEGALGKYVALNRYGGGQRLQVRVVGCYKGSAAGNQDEGMREDVFARVLNGTEMVDFRLISRSGQDVYFFIKNPIWKSSEDIVQLRRLGPRVNLTMHESETDNSKILDVKVHLLNTVINVRYGTEADVERIRLLRHSLKATTRRAWIREKARLLEKKPLSLEWSKKELKQIEVQGYADGYDVVNKRSVQEYPELANDLENVQFVKSKRSGRQHA